MEIQLCTKSDFDQILADISDFWGSDRTLAFHHPIFLYEFGNSAFVIRAHGKVIAYLFGILSQTEATGYVHLVGVRKEYQANGLGKQLYQHFIEFAKQNGCTKLKAITTPGNTASIAFHLKLGMTMIGEKNETGIVVVKDYSGPGQDRVVFEQYI